MARKADIAAAKARKQKMTLIVLGVLFVGIAAFQGPKLMKQLKGSSSSTAAPATTTTTDTTGAGTTTTTPTTTPYGGTTSPAVATGSGPSAKVAGIVLQPAGPPAAQQGQLWSLSVFKTKDPFVQQVKGAASATGTTSTGAGSSPVSSPTPAPTGKAGSPSGVVTTPTTPTAVAPALLAYATLLVNGKIQQLQLKQLFPKSLPTFVLLGVDKNSVRIGVAGGKFVGGGAVKLEIGKAVTVMNTTTGQRFVMKLTFTGAAPEQIAGFKPAPQNGTATNGQTATQATP